MKKIISTLLVTILVGMNCAVNMTLAHLSMWENTTHEHMSVDSGHMNHCEDNNAWCNDQAHDCCLSPFTDSHTPVTSDTHNDKKKKVSIWSDSELVWIINNKYKQQYCLNRKHSPPNEERLNFYTYWDQYVYLIGILKNNC